MMAVRSGCCVVLLLVMIISVCGCVVYVHSLLSVRSGGFGLMDWIMKRDFKAPLHGGHFWKDMNSFVRPALSVKIYVPVGLRNKILHKSIYPGFIANVQSSGILNASAMVYRVHNEYGAGVYMLYRVLSDTDLFTYQRSDADLCFPSCSDTAVFSDLEVQVLQFAVASYQDHRFSGCRLLLFGIESALSACTFPVPYWHSIYFDRNMSIPSMVPETSSKNVLLCFMGSVSRGVRNREFVSKMSAISTEVGMRYGVKLFETKLVLNFRVDYLGAWNSERFLINAWELYADSIFSWQPYGDTETRRGFYDSWMLGCIPVISRTSSLTYAHLFRGNLFGVIGPGIEEVAIVLDDDMMNNGAFMVDFLTSISVDEIRIRRRWLNRLAPLMQWGWNVNRTGDALLMAIASAMR
jgi:hypothetical protein